MENQYILCCYCVCRYVSVCVKSFEWKTLFEMRLFVKSYYCMGTLARHLRIHYTIILLNFEIDVLEMY